MVLINTEFFVYKSIKTKMSYQLLRKYWDTGLYETTYINISNLSEPSQLIIFIDLEMIYLNHTDNFSTKSLPWHSVKTSRAVKKAFLQQKPVHIWGGGEFSNYIFPFLFLLY